jgi:hypothetical protein
MKADRVFLARMVDNQTAGGAFDDEENVVADFTLPAQTFFWLKVLQPGIRHKPGGFFIRKLPNVSPQLYRESVGFGRGA